MSKKSRAFSFSTTPSIKMSRTKMPLSYNRTMSASLGDLHIMYFEEVLPGDTFKVKSKIISRLTSSFIKPAFANIFLDTYYFFVPTRLVFDKWSQIFGDNPNGAWANTDNVVVPSVPLTDMTYGTVYDDLELPIFDAFTSGYRIDISVLPFRANALVYNDWFRDENYIQPMNIEKGDRGESEHLNLAEWGVNNYMGKLPKVSKFHDYFTSLLPAPQKGSVVDVLSGQDMAAFIPLVVNPNGGLTPLNGVARVNGSSVAKFVRADTSGNLQIASASHSLPTGSLVGSRQVNFTNGTTGTIPDSDQTVNIYAHNSENITSTNLGISNPFALLSVNDLRIAFQTQKMLEKDAMYGTRYVEYLLGHFGVSSPDARLQRPEFLGGRRLNIGISQVAQTSSSSESGALADLAGYSLSDGSTGFSKGFTEHGFIIGYCVYRQFHTYQQGVDRRFTRFSRLDYYDPVFANIGNMPVYQYEIYADCPKENIIGYKEAWADYRFHPNRVTGQMRSSVTNSLDMWHLADEYSNAPVVSKEFLEETPNYLDRAITVDSDVQDQFILDIWHDVEAVRVMPLRSLPGLIDHH